jgi:hypothetical protein
MLSLVCFGCAPTEQPQPAPHPAIGSLEKPWVVSIGVLSKNRDAYVDQAVRVKLPAGRYRVRGRAVVVPTVEDPNIDLIVFRCDDPPRDSSCVILIRGIVLPLSHGEAVIVEGCTFKVDSER